MNRPQSQVRMHLQNGQALSEFLVVSLALLPLLLLMPLIGKYQDISLAAQAASRYVAFDAMVRNDSVATWTSEPELAEEVRRRFFSDPAAPIKTHDAAGDFKAHHNLFWRGPQDQPLIASFADDVQIDFGQAGSADRNAAFRNASDDDSFTGYERLSLKARGIYTAGVHIKIARLPDGLGFYEPFNQIDLRIRRQTSVLPDHWAGRSATDMQARLDDEVLYPASILRPAKPVFQAAVLIAELPPWGDVPAPKLGDLDFWKDTVPQDRLRR